MAFSELELKRIDRTVGDFCRRHSTAAAMAKICASRASGTCCACGAKVGVANALRTHGSCRLETIGFLG
jgi:hypothetical protein